MITIISGTNRTNNNTIKVANIYKDLLFSLGQESQILDLRELPKEFLFSALYENIGKDKAFNELIVNLKQSEKFVFIVPEYNGSFPGVLKAFLDGLNYPSPLSNKKGALVGISSGSMAGALALSHLTDILNYLGMNVMAIKPRLPRIETLIDDGKITDKFLASLLESQARHFISF